MEEEKDQETPGDGTCSLFAVRNLACDPILRDVRINQVPINMELDTVSVITQRTYQKIAQQNYIQHLQHSS